jgi:hypothetical protein
MSTILSEVTLLIIVGRPRAVGPRRHAWPAFISELFSTRICYSGASLGYQIAGVPGGLVSISSLTLLDRFGSPCRSSLYVLVGLLTTMVLVCGSLSRGPDHLHKSGLRTAGRAGGGG